MLKSQKSPFAMIPAQALLTACMSARLRILFLTIPLLLLSACNTPQQKAHNTPAPIPPPQQTSQPSATDSDAGAPQQQGEEKGETHTAEAQESAAKALAEQPKNPAQACEPNRPPASPDVEITDVPLDKDGNPIEPEPQALASSKQAQEDCKTAKNSAEKQQAEQKPEQKTTQQVNAEKQRATQKSAGGGMASKAQTSEEKLARASAKLDARLAAFDEAMRRAREAAEQQRQAQGAGTSGGLGGEFGGLGGNPNMPETARGEGGQADTASGLGHTPDLSGETQPGNYKHAATGPIPVNIPDGRDDDIVARQLREAASKESDPVLREKLWGEYKKYKTGIVGR